MVFKEYELILQRKLSANAAKIPKEWRLAAKFIENVGADSSLNVLEIPRICGILDEKELDITENYDATALLDKMANKQFSSYEVVLAFCKRAAIAHQLINCLTEIMFEDALARAKACDEYLESNGTTLGPLHGLPISFKDSFNIKGYQTTMGYVSFTAHPPATNNSGCVDVLLQAGAVCYVKTNVPQTLMCADSVNNIFGRTLNPNKLSLTAGGSTGGEGALLKIRGSVLGIGTDLAGSVRIPALCNGVFGFKPSASRIPYAGEVWGGRLGNPSQILSSIGPEGHSVRDMELFMRVVIDSEPWYLDQSAIAVPWRRTEPPSHKLRLGMILEDSKRPLHPPMLRTMKSAEKELTAAGHTIMSMAGEIPSIWDTACLAWKYVQLDPKNTSHAYLVEADEPIIKSLIGTRYPENEGWQPSLDELWDMNLQRSNIMKVYHEFIIQNQLDAFIMPPYQSTAQPHDLYGAVPYTGLANFLNYPAASIPYLNADKELDKAFVRAEVTYEPPYDPDAIEGAPSGIQIIGKPMKDEELMKIMAIVTDVLKAKS